MIEDYFKSSAVKASMTHLQGQIVRLWIDSRLVQNVQWQITFFFNTQNTGVKMAEATDVQNVVERKDQWRC